MPLPKELSFKSGAKYTVGQAFSDSYTSTEREQLRQLLVGPDIFVSKSAAFNTKYLDIYDKYVLAGPRATEGNLEVASRWHNAPMDFWQTQLNFATWCATTGCGVSVHDHINGRYDFAPESAQLSKSIFRFHVYYQTRRILHHMRAALPTDESWNAFTNAYDHTAYQTICNEFGVDPQKSDWRTTRGTQWLAKGPGSYMDRFGFHPQSYLKQSADATNGFINFMLDQTQGFTHAGVERLNDSIRTYVWAILGAQDEERTPILGSGTAFTAQKRFLTDMEAAITQAGETPVTKYQSVLQYARGKLDFVLGEQLYICPSDMTLASLANRIAGYNNEILVATVAMSPGTNQTLNTEKHPPPLQSNTDRPSIPGPSVSQSDSQQSVAKLVTKQHSQGVTADSATRTQATSRSSNSHEDTKTLLTVAAIGASIIYYLWR